MDFNYEQHKNRAEEDFRKAETERLVREIKAWEIVRNSRFLKNK